MDAAGYEPDDLDLDPILEVSSGDGEAGPPTPPDRGEGGPGRGRRRGPPHRRVWPWIAGIVVLLGLERVVVWNVTRLDGSWLWVIAIGGALAAGVAIAVGGVTISRLRRLDAPGPPS